MQVATWNVNSLPVRLEQVLTWLQQSDTDVLLLQETKVTDDKFPQQAIEDAGFQVCFSGQKTYNGVAIISKQPQESVQLGMPGWEDEQVRVISATIAGRRFINIYVPNGQKVGSDKYAYKLNWLAHLRGWIEAELHSYPELFLMGDFNIAPRDEDVHDPEAWKGSVLVSPQERAALADILALGLFDTFVEKPRGEVNFSWWDYRQASFRRNMGLRIDLICISHALLEQAEYCEIDKKPRGWERPSDHTPVTLKLRK